MFEPIDDCSRVGTLFLHQGSRYLLQLVFAYPFIAIASLPLSALLASWGISGKIEAYKNFVGFDGIACLYAGLLIGWAVATLMPSFLRTGRWMRLLPLCALLGYSAGMLFALDKRKLAGKARVARRIWNLSFWLATFVLAIALMLHFEHGIIDWGRQCGFGSIPTARS